MFIRPETVVNLCLVFRVLICHEDALSSLKFLIKFSPILKLDISAWKKEKFSYSSGNYSLWEIISEELPAPLIKIPAFWKGTVWLKFLLGISASCFPINISSLHSTTSFSLPLSLQTTIHISVYLLPSFYLCWNFSSFTPSPPICTISSKHFHIRTNSSLPAHVLKCHD